MRGVRWQAQVVPLVSLSSNDWGTNIFTADAAPEWAQAPAEQHARASWHPGAQAAPRAMMHSKGGKANDNTYADQHVRLSMRQGSPAECQRTAGRMSVACVCKHCVRRQWRHHSLMLPARSGARWRFCELGRGRRWEVALQQAHGSRLSRWLTKQRVRVWKKCRMVQALADHGQRWKATAADACVLLPMMWAVMWCC
jgi:hypothetical protein